MIVPRPLLMALEDLITPMLRLDPELPGRLAVHAGAVLLVEVEGLGVEVAMEFTEAGLRLHPSPPTAPSTVIRGAPAGLLRLAAGVPPAVCGVRLEGDVRLAQLLAGTLREADLDWEEALSRLTGDVIAHQVGRGVRGVGRFLGRAVEQFQLDLTEYLRDEARLLADPHFLRRWVGEVDELVEAEARLEARIRRLEARCAGNAR